MADGEKCKQRQNNAGVTDYEWFYEKRNIGKFNDRRKIARTLQRWFLVYLFLYPKTLKELTERVVDYAPVMLIQNRTSIRFTSGKEELDGDLMKAFTQSTDTFAHKYDAPIRSDFANREENSFLVNFGYASAVVTYDGEPAICASESKKIRIRFINNVKAHGNQPHTLRIKCISAPEGFTLDKPDTLVYLPHWSLMTEEWVSEPQEILITAGEKVEAVNRLAFEVTEAGRYTAGYIPVTFLNK